ncbi:MAG: endolytic transglycosylase MltG [Desulfamplus sp.]|nr:endolytic transglycosylase MltG [Desulfamplus sp.]
MKNIIKNILITLFVSIFILTIGFFSFMAYLQHFAKTPFKFLPTPSQSNNINLIKIRHGESLSNIAKKLETSAIISNQYLFMILARYKGDSKNIKAGEYEFSNKDIPENILDMLVRGKVKLYKITIPEGLNIKEIAEIVEKAGFGTSEDFIKNATDKIFISSLGIEADSLEGYLFPETYFFPTETNHKKIISSMVHHFNKVFTPDWKDTCKKLGLTIHEIITLASIIEKETANSAERPLISSVFHNRLKRGMRLESDPTVIYAIPNFNGNITKKDLLAPTPYNTYLINGLPSGPIANPGKLSIEAALFPPKSDFLFFVSKNDSTHYFSKNIKEHNLAVRKYQLNQ